MSVLVRTSKDSKKPFEDHRNGFLSHAVNCGRLCCWRRQSVFLFVYEISREPLNGFAPNSQERRVWSLARVSLKVKVKGQGHQGQQTASFGPFGGVRAVYVSSVW